MSQLTHTLRITHKTPYGRRYDVAYPITERQATDPAERAAAISKAAGIRADRMVNWTVEPA